ncbi:MAG: 1-acyl-sn-glycerol-3-phosphate acyltransferase [Clostridia bacterium]|nr:1-acyl-sn-glycerol-3-phosphate acyltransferase [Clostridia bacterium]
MIIGDNKDLVIDNIKRCAESGQFHEKVEVDDPNLTREQKRDIARRHMAARKTKRYREKNRFARFILGVGGRFINISTKIDGLDRLSSIKGGAIVTSNHFNPLDNTAVWTAVRKSGRKRLYIVSQDTNLAMTGFIGFLMKYSDIVPITSDYHYMAGPFIKALCSLVESGQFVLIYPEQEMWFNYKKPRPPRPGAYYYAAKFGVPIVSCFVEIKNRSKKENDSFYKTSYIVHILPTIHPDPNLTVRQNSSAMMTLDYKQKAEAYEDAYGKKLDYKFEDDDIAGWIPHGENKNMKL